MQRIKVKRKPVKTKETKTKDTQGKEPSKSVRAQVRKGSKRKKKNPGRGHRLNTLERPKYRSTTFHQFLSHSTLSGVRMEENESWK